MQIGSDNKIFILDLIKLYNDASEILDNCLSQILQSYRILKLGIYAAILLFLTTLLRFPLTEHHPDHKLSSGYNFQCDIKQLALSYGDLECFKHYDMLLDIQNVFKEPCGGLSGLTKVSISFVI